MTPYKKDVHLKPSESNSSCLNNSAPTFFVYAVKYLYLLKSKASLQLDVFLEKIMLLCFIVFVESIGLTFNFCISFRTLWASTYTRDLLRYMIHLKEV